MPMIDHRHRVHELPAQNPEALAALPLAIRAAWMATLRLTPILWPDDRTTLYSPAARNRR
jgi:uncharacterized Zn finger protein